MNTPKSVVEAAQTELRCQPYPCAGSNDFPAVRCRRHGSMWLERGCSVAVGVADAVWKATIWEQLQDATR